MTKQPVPLSQSKLTLYALHHPVRLTVSSAAIIFVWAMMVVRDWRAAALAGAGTAILVGYLWSPWGWARKREHALYDENGERRK